MARVLVVLEPDVAADSRATAVIAGNLMSYDDLAAGLDSTVTFLDSVHPVRKDVLSKDEAREVAKMAGQADSEEYLEYLMSNPSITLVVYGSNVTNLTKVVVGDDEPKKCLPGQLRLEFGSHKKENGFTKYGIVVGNSEEPGEADRVIEVFYPLQSDEEDTGESKGCADPEIAAKK